MRFSLMVVLAIALLIPMVMVLYGCETEKRPGGAIYVPLPRDIQVEIVSKREIFGQNGFAVSFNFASPDAEDKETFFLRVFKEGVDFSLFLGITYVPEGTAEVNKLLDKMAQGAVTVLREVPEKAVPVRVQIDTKSQPRLKFSYFLQTEDGTVFQVTADLSQKATSHYLEIHEGGPVALAVDGEKLVEARPELEPEPEPNPAEEAREKAVEMVKKMLQRQSEVFKIALAKNNFSTFNADMEKIQIEETGIDKNMSDLLVLLHVQASPKKAERGTDRGLILEYLRLSLQYPETDEEALLDLFVEAAKNGETEIDIMVLPTIYGFSFELQIKESVELPAAVLSEEEAREMVDKVFERFKEAHKKLFWENLQGGGSFNKLLKEEDRIIEEETGIKTGIGGSQFFYRNVILRAESKYYQEQNLPVPVGAECTTLELLVEYLQLRSKHPEKNRIELFWILLESIRIGKTDTTNDRYKIIF